MSFSPRWDTPSATPHAWPSGAACAALTGWHAVLHEDGFPGHPPAALLYGRALLFRPTSILDRRWEVDKAFAEITFSVILGHLSSIYPRINSVFPEAALSPGSCSGASRSAGGWRKCDKFLSKEPTTYCWLAATAVPPTNASGRYPACQCVGGLLRQLQDGDLST